MIIVVVEMRISRNSVQGTPKPLESLILMLVEGDSDKLSRSLVGSINTIFDAIHIESVSNTIRYKEILHATTCPFLKARIHCLVVIFIWDDLLVCTQQRVVDMFILRRCKWYWLCFRIFIFILIFVEYAVNLTRISVRRWRGKLRRTAVAAKSTATTGTEWEKEPGYNLARLSSPL